MNICSDVFSRSRNSFKNQITDLPVAMAEKNLRILSTNGDEQKVSVLDTTTVREILQQFEEDDEQDRQGSLLRGVTVLEPDMTVNQAGLEDGEEISLVWSDPFIEMDRWNRWTDEEMDGDLYVRVPSHITQIDYGAFSGCKALVKIVIPDSVTSIGNRAFSGCRKLTQVKIPRSVTSIGSMAFGWCSSLTQVKIPNSVTSIGDGAFGDCSSLTQVEIPDSVTSIGYAAFYGCSSLTGVEIPDSVTSIGAEAFDNCSALTEVQINNSATRIGKHAFPRWTSLTGQVSQD